MRFINNEKGVTVMSLVITIIIMVILAAVSLNGAFGGEGSKNSLVERAKDAIYKSEVEDLKDFWESKLVDVDTTYLNYDSLEDVMDEEQIPESLRGVFAVKQGRLVYKDDQIDDTKKELLKEFEIYSEFVNPIEVTIKATIKKVTEAKSADVIAVIDASSSMRTNTGTKRYANVVPALNELMSTVLEADENNRVGIVSFDEYFDVILDLKHYELAPGATEYVTLKSYTSDSSPVGVFNVTPSKVSDYYLGSGTNASVGFGKAEQMFLYRRSASNPYQESEKSLKNKTDYMIILSDGESAYSVKEDSYDLIESKFSFKNTNGMNSTTKKWYRESITQGNGRVYKTIKYAKTIKDNHVGDLKIYTINYSTGTQSKATMNPTEENINKLSGNEYKSEMIAMGNYADEAYSEDDPNFDLKKIFAKISQDIISQDNTVVEMDKTERYTSVIIENKMQFYDENGNLVEYQLDEAEGDVVVKVNAAVFVPTAHTDASGNIIRAADTARTKTYSKSYTIADIKEGRDKNLKYENGNIVWDIEADFDKDSTSNIKSEAINYLLGQGVTYDTSLNETVDIASVEIILPLVTYAE